MSTALAIARRDFAAMFHTPSGWVILAVWGFIASIIFSLMTLLEGEPATERAVIVVGGWVAAILIPAISMRAFAEEHRQGTLETLMSSPVALWALVGGKFLACMAILVVLGVPVLALAGVGELYGRVDGGELLSGLLGLLLMGSAMTSLGLLVSSRTNSQVVAYLVTFFVWFGVILIMKGVPGLLPQLLPATADAAWINSIAALDPLLRLDEFALGLFDTGNVVWFLALAGFFFVATTVSLTTPILPRHPSLGGRLGSYGSSILFVLCAAVIAGSIASIFSVPSLRIERDFTKTRAYSLSDGTTALLESLKPEWSVHLLVSDASTDAVTLRHVDEVLERMTSVTDALWAERVDPSDPTAMARYDVLLERLLEREHASIEAWNQAIDGGTRAFESLRRLGAVVVASAREVMPQLEATSAAASAVERIGATLGTVADQGGEFVKYLRNALETSRVQPLPAWGLVKAALVANNELHADELEQLADLLRQWAGDEAFHAAARRWAVNQVDSIEAVAIELRSSVDRLKRLPELEVARLGTAVTEGDLAIVVGPEGFLIVPPWQLFPPLAVTRDGGSVIGFDRRFRGEEALSGAIRALRSGVMPRVVFVHPEERSMLRAREDGLDVFAVAEAMRTARMTVEEWMPGQTTRPGAAAAGAPTVWVVLPPIQRSGLEYSTNERAVINATIALLAEGKNVLITPARSLLPLIGQKDPWGTIAKALGATIETGRVIYEFVPAASSEGEPGVSSVQAIDHAPPNAGILGAALRGKRLLLNHPTPIRLSAEASVDHQIVAVIEPTFLRFIEDDWRGNGARIKQLPTEKRFAESIPVVVALEREDQRVLLVGSGGWMLSAIVGDAGTLGGNRVVFLNPGNRELALSGVAWLAAMDELVATSASGGEIARFQGVTPAGRLAWGIALPLVFGVGPLVAGGIVVGLRRRSA